LASCTELERGARMVDAMITNTMLPEIDAGFFRVSPPGSEIKCNECCSEA